MRPKKRILLVDRCRNRRSVTRFVMKTWSYRVVTSPSVELVLGADRSVIGHIDLVVGIDIADDRELGEIAASFNCPSLIVFSKKGERTDVLADEILVRPSMEMFLEAVQRRSRRKREPRIGWKKDVQREAPIRMAWEVAA